MIKIKKLVKNYWKGRDGHIADVIVIHIANAPSLDIIWQTFLNEEKSTHYAIGRAGEVWQFVEETDSAWGNGNLSNPTSEIVKQRINLNPNLYTISIEHVGYGTQDINSIQYDSSSSLILDICTRNNIPIDRQHIIGHNEITDKKNCPGKISVDALVQLALKKKQLLELKGKILKIIDQEFSKLGMVET